LELLETSFMKGFIRLAKEGYSKNWHELNGGNLTYIMTDVDIAEAKSSFTTNREWTNIGAIVQKLANCYFTVTGSGKFFGNIEHDPVNNIGIIEIDETGANYRVVWGLENDARPTSELPSHLLNHQVKLLTTNGKHRVIYHAHPKNLIALTFVLPLEDAVFTRELWEVMTECPVVFPEGIGVLKWMVPGSFEIAVATSELMKDYNIAVWAHHGLFVSGADFDKAFGLMHTVEKSADILVKIKAMGGKKQTITVEDFRTLAKAFNVKLNEAALY